MAGDVWKGLVIDISGIARRLRDGAPETESRQRSKTTSMWRGGRCGRDMGAESARLRRPDESAKGQAFKDTHQRRKDAKTTGNALLQCD